MKKDFELYKARVEELLSNGLSVRKISKMVDLSTQTLRKYLREYGIEYDKNPFTDLNLISKCITEYSQGISIERLAVMYGVGSTRIRTLLVRNGIELRSPSDNNRTRFGYTINHEAFKNTADPQIQYLLGFLMTDGNITDAGRVSITLKNTDKHILIQFQELLGMNYGLKDSSVLDKRTNKRYYRSTLAFNCEDISKDLTRLGLRPRKSMNEQLPNCELTRDFWRGVVDGDGCIHIGSKGTNSCALTLVGSVEFLQGFVSFLEKFFVFNTKRKVVKNKNNALCNVQLTGDDARKAITILYKDSSIALRRKQNLSEKVWNVK